MKLAASSSLRSAAFVTMAICSVGSLCALRLQAEGECSVVLFSGEETRGELVDVLDDRLRLGERSFAYHELQEIRFGGEETVTDVAREIAERPFLQFVGGEIVFVRVERSDDKAIEILVRGERTEKAPSGEKIGALRLPLSSVRAFRLREAHPSDDNFELNLLQPGSGNDRLFVRKGDRLLRVEGFFAGIDDEKVNFEYRDEKQRLRRSRVQGVLLSRVAGNELEHGYGGTLWLAGGGRLPVVLLGIEKGSNDTVTRLRVKVHGEPWSVRLSQVRRVTFESERLVFLSDLDPALVEEVGLFDGAFPYRRDQSVGGEVLQYDGVEYPKGLGVHSRTVLEYILADDFSTFSARVAIQSTLKKKGDATVRVVGDGRSLFTARVHGNEVVEVLLPIRGIKRLRLETDFGDDGVDMGDHVNWIGARLVRVGKRPGKRINAKDAASTEGDQE